MCECVCVVRSVLLAASLRECVCEFVFVCYCCFDKYNNYLSLLLFFVVLVLEKSISKKTILSDEKSC